MIIGKHKIGVSITDGLFVLFTLSVICSSHYNNSNIVNSYLMVLIPCYFLIRFFNGMFMHTKQIIIILISTVCILECVLGLLQIISITIMDSTLSLRGTFINSGPYGGFLSVCATVLLPYIKTDDKKLKRFAKVALIAVIIILPATLSRAAIISCVICFCWFAFSNEKKFKQFICSHKLFVTLVVVVLLIGAYKFKQGSADGRFFINKISFQMLLSNKLYGVGIGKYPGSYGEAQYNYFKNKTSGIIDDISIKTIYRERMIADCPGSAFNDYLQIGVESGIIAMILFIVMIIYTIFHSMKQHSIWSYGLISFSFFSLFSFPLELFQFQLLFSIILAMSIGTCSDEKKTANAYLYIIPVILIIVLLISNFGILMKRRESKKQWFAAGKWYDKKDYEYVLSDYPNLFDDLKDFSQYLFEYGHSLNKMGYYEKSDSILLLGTSLSSDPMFWNVMGNNSMALGRFREAEERYKHAFYMVPNRLYPLYLIAKLYYIEGDTARFHDMAGLIETFIPKVESANTKRLSSEIRELNNSYLSEGDWKE